jgi:type II secretory pathway pseudopilin PulG
MYKHKLGHQNMLKILPKSLRHHDGFTVPELLLVIAMVIILSGLVLTNFQAAKAKERDTQRVNDINTIYSRLEAYYNTKSSYPATFSAKELGIEDSDTQDPHGRAIIVHVPVTDALAAQQVANPTSNSSANYLYVPFPAGCTNAANNCTGYILKTYIEKPTNTTPNPYAKVGLNNL